MANRTKGPKKKGASKRRKKGAAPASTPLQPVEAEALIEDAPGQTLPFPVVCVGASAGGLEAFTQLLQALPLDTGMAFVLVSHLSPTHASHLADILSRATKLPVSEVRDEAAVGPDRVYVIPPDRSMIISQGVIKLRPRLEVRGVHHPIDEFLQSLAEDQGHKSIGVILSGTANDGTLGLEEIKAQGGITFAQDNTAQYDGMPRSAVLAGCVDFVLPPAAIARELARIARHPYVTRTDGPESSDALTRDERQHFVKILQLLNIRMGVDFTEYKANTLQRRVRRRMALHRIELLKDYAQYLHARPPELDSLYQDILITVTSFFRNPEAFEVLRDRIFPKLVAERNTKDPLRVWVLGCSTGEEAYSIAITFAEFMEESGGAIPIQIFATDVNGATIEKARAGTYPKTVAEHISPERLRRHFAEVDGHYRVAKPIREMCIFARHNGLSDPPFSRVDLISCRNLLIYLEPRTQNKLLPTLHFALKPHGVLWLGSSESIGVL
ncbi:MAG TPA: chemotaxis protein CheB, partial [Gemmatimonadales bacterium]|nr:chemotaxis protein CheB [Gemmatimonadales bacterium]